MKVMMFYVLHTLLQSIKILGEQRCWDDYQFLVVCSLYLPVFVLLVLQSMASGKFRIDVGGCVRFGKLNVFIQ